MRPLLFLTCNIGLIIIVSTLTVCIEKASFCEASYKCLFINDHSHSDCSHQQLYSSRGNRYFKKIITSKSQRIVIIFLFSWQDSYYLGSGKYPIHENPKQLCFCSIVPVIIHFKFKEGHFRTMFIDLKNSSIFCSFNKQFLST